MKDSVVVIAEALRLARLEVEWAIGTPNCRASAQWTIKRLDRLLNDPSVTAAMAGTSCPIWKARHLSRRTIWLARIELSLPTGANRLFCRVRSGCASAGSAAR